MKAARLAIALVFVSAAVLADLPPPARPGPNYVSDVEHYRAWRVNDDKTRWATLAGLFWLQPGTVWTLGSAPDNKIVLPKSAPAHAGKIEFAQSDLMVTLERGVKATANGKPYPGGMILSDHDGKNTSDVIEMGQVRMTVIQRGKRTGLRVWDMAGAKDFHAPEWYKVDPAYRVVAKWEPTGNGKKIIVPNVLGDAMEITVPGIAHFTLNGKQFSLMPYEGDPNKSMEFIFSDATTNKETYPAGRMVDAGPVQPDGTLVIDFNEAYNPPCAVTPYATCPIAPRENRLSVPVAAGAKYDKTRPHPGKVFVAQ